MNKFVSGLITGGVVGAIRLTYMLSDRRTRKKMAKDSKKLMNRAADMVDW